VRPTTHLVLLLSVLFVSGCGKDSSSLRLATTTSVDNSGLLQAILPSFRQETGIEVQVLAVGSGRAVELLRRGDADMALTHDPVIEAMLLKERPVAAYRKIMFNDFVVVGPEQDEAGVRDATHASDAMRRIAMSAAVFVSRGDESGTHAREQQLWSKAGARPRGDHLLETGQGMAATLRVASERHAYTLTDRATLTQLAPALTLKPLFENDPDLLNTYAVIVPETTRESGAIRFMTWLSEGDGRDRIASFTIAGTHPFIIWPAGKRRDRPDALPR
jgi:tungstate transport system substrate-binding protein